MKRQKESLWFEGTIAIECSITKVQKSFENLGEHYVGVIRFMPGLDSIELVEEGTDYVIIKTNEGLMKRTNITRRIGGDSIVVEFDEEYTAGRMITTSSHYLEEFSALESGIEHRTVLTNVEASGLLGFFYRTFGKSNIGRALLKSYKNYFEK